MAKLITLWLTALIALPPGSVAARTPPAGRQTGIAFKIAEPLAFKGRVVSGSLRQSDIPRLLDLPVRNGNTGPAERYGVEMTRPNHTTFTAYTCREWKKARAAGAYSATTYDMAMESSFIDTCGLLFELQKAKLPIKSFIANPRVTLADVNLLPAEILASLPEGGEPDRLRGKTVADAVPPQDIKEAEAERLTVSYGGLRQSFWEGARADFNGDGIEDILVFTGGRAEGGTMGYADYFILTRTSAAGPLKLINTPSPSWQSAK